MDMKVTFDPAKRDVAVRERGLDFATDAVRVFEGRTLTWEDDRHAYGETRYITAGPLGKRMVLIV